MKINQPYKDNSINICLDTINKKKQALLFVNTKRSAEKSAEDLSKKIMINSKVLHDLSEKILNDLSKPTKQCRRLALCVKKGIAFHHAGLTSNQKTLIEDSFRSGIIKIIACTPTLAAGLDMPAFRTILKDLKRFGARGMQYISVLEYLQMSGRAGRPGYEDFGEAIILAGTEEEKNLLVEKYVFGEPEDIYSKLAVEPVLRTYLLSLISTGIVNTKKEIIKFFEETFWAHQFKDMNRLELIIEKMLGLLEHWEFIRCSNTADKNGFVSAYSIKDENYKSTYLGKRVAELYLDPLTAHQLIKGMRKGTAMKSVEHFALIQMVCHTLELRPLLRVKTKEMEDIQEMIVRYEEDLLEKEPSIYEPEYDDFLNSIKTAKCIYDWVDEISEEKLLEEYNVRPGELKIKLDTTDWLLYASYELARIQQFKELMKEIAKVRLRIKHGAKEELLPLLRLKGIGRVRARKLFINKIKDVGDIKKTDANIISHLIGKSIAISLKKQVGEDVDKIVIKPKKKKGQISLMDF